MCYTYVKGVVYLSHLSNFQNKNKYLAMYEFSTGETLNMMQNAYLYLVY